MNFGNNFGGGQAQGGGFVAGQPGGVAPQGQPQGQPQGGQGGGYAGPQASQQQGFGAQRFVPMAPHLNTIPPEEEYLPFGDHALIARGVRFAGDWFLVLFEIEQSSTAKPGTLGAFKRYLPGGTVSKQITSNELGKLAVALLGLPAAQVSPQQGIELISELQTGRLGGRDINGMRVGVHVTPDTEPKKNGAPKTMRPNGQPYPKHVFVSI